MSTSDQNDSQLLAEAVRGRGNVSDLSPEAIGSSLSSEMLAGINQNHAEERRLHDLPASILGLRIDRVPILIGALPTTPEQEAVVDALRKYRNQATIARSWLAADAQNLLLFLVGPAGSESDPDWREVAEWIEADDRVCRKMVWLPPSNPARNDADAFLARTFLGRPWLLANAATTSRLDQMSTIELPTGWIEVLADELLDADAVVARLVETTDE